MTRTTRVSLPVTALALLLSAALAPQAVAGGFQLKEQSASGQGNAYAGISAGGADISGMFFNPASLTLFSGTQLQLGASAIAPSAEFSNGVASRSAIPAVAPFATVTGSPSTGNAAQSAVTPNLYAMWSLSPNLKAGVAVNVPYGLTTQYSADWMGRYHAIKSHLETIDIAPTVAYRLNGQWSFGASFIARHAKAELSNAIDLGYSAYGALAAYPGIANAKVLPGSADGLAVVRGDAWAYGFKAGVLFQPTSALRLGLGYQSAITSTLKGHATFDVPASLYTNMGALAAANPAYAAVFSGLGAALAAKTGASAVTAEMNLPAVISLGINYDVSKTFSVQAEFAQTQWSKFQELRVKFANPVAQPDSYTTENWKNSTFMSVGATCKPGDGWTYRLGVAVDQAPVPDANRTPRIPDADRTWISAGMGYQVSKTWGWDVGVTHIFCKDSTVALLGGTNPASQDFGKGNLSGSYKNSINILSVQLHYNF